MHPRGVQHQRSPSVDGEQRDAGDHGPQGSSGEAAHSGGAPTLDTTIVAKLKP
jgi:hypothetical protein